MLSILAFHSALFGGLLQHDASGMLRVVQWLSAGSWVGIDIFFALSGFLIGRILLEQLTHGSIRFAAFYIRRTFRIFPAYYVVLTASLMVFTWLSPFRLLYWNLPWHVLARGSWANYLYVSNYVFGRQPNVMSWGWSLCVEEHFYVLLPTFLAGLFRYASPRGRVAALLIFPFIPMLLRLATFLQRPSVVVLDGLYYQSHTHCDGLLVGVLVAYLHVYHGSALAQLARRGRRWVAPAGLACVAMVLLWGGLERPGLFPVVFQFLALAVGTSLLVVNGTSVNNSVSRFLGHPFWYPVARVSYGVYLVHPFAIFGVLSLWPGGSAAVTRSLAHFAAFAVAVATVAFAGAVLLFVSVERRMLARGARLSRVYASDTPQPPPILSMASK